MIAKSMSEPLWSPSRERMERTNLSRFIGQVRTSGGAGWEQQAIDYEALYEWSVVEPARFWQAMWDFGGIRASRGGGPVVVDLDRMPGAKFFPNVSLNFAENLLCRGSGPGPAMIFTSETGATRTVT